MNNQLIDMRLWIRRCFLLYNHNNNFFLLYYNVLCCIIIIHKAQVEVIIDIDGDQIAKALKLLQREVAHISDYQTDNEKVSRYF